MEVYRSDGKLAGLSDLADTHELVKLGGSDYHGRGGQYESDLGSVHLPLLALQEFLKLAQPIWCGAINDILLKFVKEPSDSNLEKIVRFGKSKCLKVDATLCGVKDIVDLCLSSWLTKVERQPIELEASG
eukprot:TRINITY_DN6682_c0_g1_i1.p1 TRINITY_DN6682_c0_g1~~TRINITY_DN6682_c0_g1_i1.p1  ORF type:complete len:137 (-),score=24.81 TRINITY_DN6682_c0_g1_i1:44-433(-)